MALLLVVSQPILLASFSITKLLTHAMEVAAMRSGQLSYSICSGYVQSRISVRHKCGVCLYDKGLMSLSCVCPDDNWLMSLSYVHPPSMWQYESGWRFDVAHKTRSWRHVCMKVVWRRTPGAILTWRHVYLCVVMSIRIWKALGSMNVYNYCTKRR